MMRNQTVGIRCATWWLLICGGTWWMLIGSNVVAAETSESRRVHFGTDIVPLLTKLGCNGGGCHGKATGQNGFRLSLLGFESDLDFVSLVKDSRGRRLAPASPDSSLLLLKATGRMPHGGGRRLEESSDDYLVLRDWISQGAVGPQPNDPSINRIELSTAQLVLPKESAHQLSVTAYFSDESHRDVTRQAVFQSNDDDIVAVDAGGRISTSSRVGLAAVMARYGEQVATVQVAVPFVTDETTMAAVQRELDVVQRELSESPVDRHLMDQWRRLGVVPSPPANDATFVRRVTIDICGTLPTPDEISNYLADTRSDKRARLIDRLLERPEYASYFALKWADILQNRGTGYSTSQQRAGTTLFANWIRDSLAANKPYDRFVIEILTASGSQKEQPPAIWYRTVRKPAEFVESVAQAFLGTRIQCAQCHHHPTERWSQADYFGLAAVFARVGRKGGFADAEVPTDEIIYLKESRDTKHPRTGERMVPRPLGGAEFTLGLHDDPRMSLARWMTATDNPFFARTMANRMWAHFLGRGIIHPIDDARSTNPPSNPELLAALAREFTSSGYDIKHLIRVITNSYAYRLNTIPREDSVRDTQTFARFYPRRLTAEVLLDGISQVLDVPTNFPGVPAGTRAIELPDENVAAPFLDVFGRPARTTACECERVDAPALNQALELVNSSEIQRKLTAESGYAKRLGADGKTHGDRVTGAFLRVLGRPPRTEELRAGVDFLESEPDRHDACRSLLWSLLATNEFMFNH